MHHHVALDTADDMHRLVRFLTGRARGIVACGGGAFSAAHIGIVRALAESGFAFDILGGTSGGSAMMAGVALDHAPSAMSAAVDDIFVTGRAMRRYTVPRYSLIDHTHFDRLLARHFGDTRIEDLQLPYFAAATNLSRNALHLIRTGPLWQAVRASSSIPVMLPPCYTADGEMLVDGCLLDNVPVGAMRGIKSGPNVVISFEAPAMERFTVDYAALPGRTALLKAALLPALRHALPSAPGVGTVLMRSLRANRQEFERHLAPDDLLLVPPFPAGVGILDWHRHAEIADHAYRWAAAELERREAAGDPALAALRGA